MHCFVVVFSQPSSVKLAERLKQVASAVSSSIFPHNVETSTTKMSNLDAEEQAFQDEVKQLKQWWSDARWRYTRRPYTAEQIASKRGNLKIEYASNAMAKKMWKIVEKRFTVCNVKSGDWKAGLTLCRSEMLVLPMVVWIQ